MGQHIGRIRKMMILLALFAAYLVSPCAFADAPERILSITPAGTEILYDLGLGDRVVGVTKYCSWPPEAQTVPNL